ncbi:MFS transporter [Novosphingobium rhizovicinum]|uniref:MFS transporter n=1 Tax=Novosphingobium rhizovicinum TaxID=3228928 RepID=A0ABV3R6K3_9SPHN
MTYLGEFRRNLRPLLAASLGSGTSIPLFAYTNSVFAPHLVEEFGWSRAQFALIGLATLTTLVVLPFAGRFTDSKGVRPVALLGTLLVPLCFLGYAAQNGSFLWYAAVFTLVLAVGSLTSPLVYTRLIAENFSRATGLALTVVNCVPAALAIVLVPLLNWWIEVYDWRSAYLALGAVSLLGGLAAISLIPRKRPQPEPTQVAATEVVSATPQIASATPQTATARQDYKAIFSSRLFWIVFLGMFLCLLQMPLHSTQMNLMLVDNGISTQAAANIVPLYAFGTIVGRIGCGLALDRFATPPVTTISLILPAVGFFLLGTDLDSLLVIGIAMFIVGLSIGAESDLISYLVARYFKLRIYATTLGLLYCVSFLASALGALGISWTLAASGSFSPYLFFLSGAVIVGSLLFLLLPWSSEHEKVG